jgi:zinc transport system ATP-binding protein
MNDGRSTAAGRGPLLALHDVTFGYEREPALEDVSLEILPGDFLALVGPNGGGKTTLLKLFLGLLQPWKGQVVRRLLPRGGALGYVPQFSTFDKHFPLRVLDAVLMGRLGLRGMLRRDRPEDFAAARRALERLGTVHLAEAQIGELSGGELQRVLIARALAGEPEVLLLDEPTAAVDAASRRLLDTVLAEVNREIPVVVVTHDPSAIASRVTRVALVDRRLSWLSPEEIHHLHCHHHLPVRGEGEA